VAIGRLTYPVIFKRKRRARSIDIFKGYHLLVAHAGNPNCELVQFNLGVYAHMMGDRELAMASMEKVLKINPMNEQARRVIRMFNNI
jgi:hypothetical protein